MTWAGICCKIQEWEGEEEEGEEEEDKDEDELHLCENLENITCLAGGEELAKTSSYDAFTQ